MGNYATLLMWTILILFMAWEKMKNAGMTTTKLNFDYSFIFYLAAISSDASTRFLLHYNNW